MKRVSIYFLLIFIILVLVACDGSASTKIRPNEESTTDYLTKDSTDFLATDSSPTLEPSTQVPLTDETTTLELTTDDIFVVSFVTHTISYNEMIMGFGEVISEIDSPEKTGYIFLGWYLDDLYVNEVEFPYIVDDNQTFYAKWAKIDSNYGVFKLNFPDRTIDVYNSIGSYSILPEFIKDDYIFLGWTDGTNYYAGITESQFEDVELYPAHIPIEQAFNYLEVIDGQVYLGDYIADYDIVGIPYYWKGNLIVSADSFQNKDNIRKLFLPNSLNSTPNIKNFTQLTDYVFYGEVIGKIYSNSFPGYDFERLISSCTYKDGTPFILDESIPGVMNERCPINELIKRNEGIFVPGKGQFNTYQISLNRENSDYHSLQNYFWPTNLVHSLRYVVLPNDFHVTRNMFDYYNQSRGVFDNLVVLKSPLVNYIFEDNKLVYNSNTKKIIYFAYEEDEVLNIDGSQYELSRSFIGNGNFLEINYLEVCEYDGLIYQKDLDGIVYFYDFFDTKEWKLGYIPKNYPSNSIELMDGVNSSINYFVNNNINIIKLNDTIKDLDFIRNFQNLDTLLVGNNPNFVEEDGVIYTKDYSEIKFLNKEVKYLEISSSTPLINFRGVRLSSLEEIFIDQNYNGNLLFLRDITNLKSLLIHENNENFEYFPGLVKDYVNLPQNLENSKDYVEIPLYFDLVNNYYDLESQTLYLPENFTLVDHSYFSNIDKYISISRVEVDENNMYYASLNGVLYSKSLDELVYFPKYKVPSNFSMPNNMIKINIDSIKNLINQNSLNISEFFDLNYVYSEQNHINVISLILKESIKALTIDNNSDFFDELNNVVISKEGNILFFIPSDVTSATVTDSIFEIYDHAFKYANSLTELIYAYNGNELPIEVLYLDNIETISLFGNDVYKVYSTKFGYDDIEMNIQVNLFTSSLSIIYVTEELYEDYINDSFWSQFKDIIEIKPVDQ